MPSNAVYVGRPSKWGNPFKIGAPHPIFGSPMDAEDALDMYELSISDHLLEQLDELKGKDLACWCSIDQPCHADVLLRLANNKKSVLKWRKEAANERGARSRGTNPEQSISDCLRFFYLHEETD